MNYQQVWDDLPTLVGPDHPLSIGYVLKLATRDRRVPREFRASKKQWNAWRRRDSTASAAHVAWSHNRTAIIFVDHTERGMEVTRRRMIEMIVHESSHFVDWLFSQTGVSGLDTELRAYHLDHVVGKLIAPWVED